MLFRNLDPVQNDRPTCYRISQARLSRNINCRHSMYLGISKARRFENHQTDGSGRRHFEVFPCKNAITAYAFLQLAFSTSFALYRISTNPDVQRKLFDEALALLPEKEDAVSDSVIQRSVYTKAVLKEAHRIDPLTVGIGRVLTKPCVFSGYRVPEGVSSAIDAIKEITRDRR